MKWDIALKVVDYLKNTRNLITEEMALNYVALYPNWEKQIGKELIVGERIEFEDRLYKVLTTHTAQETWAPNVASTLFEPIDVINEGTLSNPIIAAAGMTYFKDKYYLDETDSNVYLCTRDDSNGNGTVLHFMPSALVGVYFALAE
jgi:hypothetical protein